MRIDAFGSRIRLAPALLALLLNVAFAHAQPPKDPAFDVATLKLSPPPSGNSININLGRFQNGRFTMNNVTLNDVIKYAYEVAADAQLAGPDWNSTVRFDIEGVALPDTPIAQTRLMLRTLLADRLHLVLRREQRTLPHLALVIAKGGPHLTPSKPGAPTAPQLPGKIAHPQMSITGLATLLSRFERQTIIDLTGLPGTYEIKLDWTPDKGLATVDPNAPPPDHPSLFAAVQEQLGLKLQSRRSPLEVLVVEKASQVPEEN